MRKKLLIICATHGNERIGLETVTELERKGLSNCFDPIVANVEALNKNVRFTDCDLNRSYPGDKGSALYEKRRAAEILEIAKGYEYVIDMHEASSGTEDFIIIAETEVDGERFYPLLVGHYLEDGIVCYKIKLVI